jgi:hypothetical protein
VFSGRAAAKVPVISYMRTQAHSRSAFARLISRVIPALFFALFSRYFALNGAHFGLSCRACIPTRERASMTGTGVNTTGEQDGSFGETEKDMNAELNQHIDQLRQMTTAQLQLKYRELFGQPSHSNHKAYLFRRVAWRMQALAEGTLSERAREYAREIAADADLRLCAPKQAIETEPPIRVANGSRQLDPRVPPPGTQLIKRYKDETLTVTVLEDGYQYRERVYKSLSAIARQVTGTQWNGYVFFGLRLRQEQDRAE